MNLKYVINTIEHYNLALDILTQSLVDDGINREDIIYVYANSKELKITKREDGIICVYVPRNLYEFTSFIGITVLMLNNVQIYQNYNYLFLHDTCKALRGFKEKSLNMNSLIVDKKFDICWVHKSGRHNLGMFSPKAIALAMKQCLMPILNNEVPFDKGYAIKMEWDVVPESFRNIKLPQWFPHDHNGIVLTPDYTVSTLYSKDKPRSIAYMTSLNLIKYYVKLGPIRPGNFADHHPQSIV